MVQLISLKPLETEPKAIYIAASMGAQKAARALKEELILKGFHVTSRWIDMDFSLKPNVLDPSYAEFERKWGNQDMEDVRAADTLVVLTDTPSSSGGLHFELGYFLGLGRTNVVASTGSSVLPNVFFYTEHVRALHTSAVGDWLQEQALNWRIQTSRIPQIAQVPPKAQVIDEPKTNIEQLVDLIQLCKTRSEISALLSSNVRESALLDYDGFVEKAWGGNPPGIPPISFVVHGLNEESAESLAKACDIVNKLLSLTMAAGNAAGLTKKGFRDRGGEIDIDPFIKELGDALFYTTKAAHLVGRTLEDVARLNQEKIQSRLDRGTLHGNGDNR